MPTLEDAIQGVKEELEAYESYVDDSEDFANGYRMALKDTISNLEMLARAGG